MVGNNSSSVGVESNVTSIDNETPDMSGTVLRAERLNDEEFTGKAVKPSPEASPRKESNEDKRRKEVDYVHRYL